MNAVIQHTKHVELCPVINDKHVIVGVESTEKTFYIDQMLPSFQSNTKKNKNNMSNNKNNISIIIIIIVL